MSALNIGKDASKPSADRRRPQAPDAQEEPPGTPAMTGTDGRACAHGCRAARRLAAFDHRHGWQLGVFSIASTVLFITIVHVGEAIQLFETGESAIRVDFYVFWAAAKLAVQGVPFDAFDVTRLQQAAGLTDPDWMPWAYPPGFMMLLMPFGLLPFTAAWALFNAIGLGALVLAVRPFTAGRLQVLLAAALAPAVLPCLIVGQTIVLWMAGLVAALAALRVDRPLLAGLFIGCLTLKPQLGLLLPVALVARGAWRAILSAVATTAVLAAVPTWLLGSGYWPRMLTMMGVHGETVRDNIAGIPLMVSPYSVMVGLGAAEPLALSLQWVITAACAGAVFFVWRNRAVSFDLRAATLLAAIPLASPYLWFYESALLAPAALFMWRAGVLRARPGAMILGLAMWLGLAPAVLVLLMTGAGLEAFRFVFVPINLAALLACLRGTLPGRAPDGTISHRSETPENRTPPCQP